MANVPSNAPSLYPADQLITTQVNYNVNEIKRYQFPDCIVSYFNYFEQWTPRFSNDERKILLNRLLQNDEIAFSIYLENVNESYEVLKSRLIEQLTECGESLLNKNKKEKRMRKRLFEKMNREEMEQYIRDTYNELNSLSKERLMIKELTRILPKKWAKKMDLENKCTTIDQVVEQLGEKFSTMKLRSENDKKKFRKHLHHRRRGSSTSSSSSSSSSDGKKKHPHHPHHPRARGHHRHHE